MRRIRSALAALGGRFGVVPRLVGAGLLAVACAAGALEALSIRDFERSRLEQAQRALDINLGVLRTALAPLGTEWRVEGGRLTLGGQPLEGRNDIVDTVKQVAGGVATVFQGDLRIATNVVRPARPSMPRSRAGRPIAAKMSSSDSRT